jgi:hypothetical protein
MGIAARSMMSIAVAASVLVLTTGNALADTSISPQRAMTRADVPKSLGTTKNYDFNNKSIDKSLDICWDSAGPIASVPAPARQAHVNIETVSKQYTSVAEVIFQFASLDDATAAFATLKAASAKCTGSTTSKSSSSPTDPETITSVLTHGAVGQGFFIQDSSTWNAPKASEAYGSKTVVFTVYSQPGDAIIETQFYVNGAAAVTSAQRAGVVNLAQTNAMHWMAR